MAELLILLLPLIAQVESGNNPDAIGDNGKAIGCMQIWKVCVDDVNRISGKHYTYKDRLSRRKSFEMAKIYLKHYGKAYEKKTGHKADMEILSRIWNCGYAGSQKGHKYYDKGTRYWHKIKKEGEK